MSIRDSLTPTRLLVKDLNLIEEVAKEFGIHLPIGKQTKNLFDKATEMGLGDIDLSALVNLFD